jgi:hypothetical protein
MENADIVLITLYCITGSRKTPEAEGPPEVAGQRD